VLPYEHYGSVRAIHLCLLYVCCCSTVCLSLCVCSLLRGDNVKLLWNVVWCLVMLSSDADTSNEIRSMGGIPLLLSMLQSVASLLQISLQLTVVLTI